jgi:surface protein
MIRRFFHSTIKDKNAFIFEINTANTSTGSTTNTEFRLPFVSAGTYNCVVDWGDSTSDVITTWNQAEATHTYASTGTYTVSISGTCIGWRFNNTGDRLKFLNILSFGILNLSTNASFYGCSNLNFSATDKPKISSSSFLDTFRGCTSFNSNINSWDVSSVTTLFNCFLGASSFNQPLNDWDVSNVTVFQSCFQSASSFNQPLNNWDVSSGTNFTSMFNLASSFNQALNNWDVSEGISMNSMFRNTNFNQPLNNWNVGKVTNFSLMFESCPINEPLNNWDVSSGTNFSAMFNVATAFNQPLNNWNVGNATNMNTMFRNAFAFDQDLGSWDVSKVSNFASFMVGKTAANYSATNLDSIYNGWSLLTFVNTGLSISFGTIKYTAAGQAGRDILTDPPNNWTITDGGI